MCFAELIRSSERKCNNSIVFPADDSRTLKFRIWLKVGEKSEDVCLYLCPLLNANQTEFSIDALIPPGRDWLAKSSSFGSGGGGHKNFIACIAKKRKIIPGKDMNLCQINVPTPIHR